MSHDARKTWYVSGPISGIPQSNFPAFIDAAQRLRRWGYEIVSPVELDDEHTRELSLASEDGKPDTGHSWGDFLSRDVKIVADEVQGIILLPGWEKSRGAKLEAFVGLLCGHEFKLYQPAPQSFCGFEMLRVLPAYVKRQITESTP